MDDQQLSQIIDQPIDFLSQLNSHEWDSIGGLNINDKGKIVLGPVLEETFWQVPDMEKLWPQGETVATLNIGGPYQTYFDYISAQIQ